MTTTPLQTVPALLTAHEVCTALRISRRTFSRLVRQGRLRTVRVGSGGPNGSIRVRADELARFLDEKETS